jgi:putative methyltransferase (TIGR04325 family)
MYTPIALFAYARPDHLRQTVETLLRNPESAGSDLIVFCDAARTQDKLLAVQAVRDYAESISGFRSVTVHHRSENFGLAKSITTGASQVLEQYDRVIVLEDDIVTSPYFLSYMNEALDRYAEDDRVISIHGYVYPVQERLPEAFFLRGADCWGWATWRRGWKLFNPDGQFLLDQLKRRKLVKSLDFDGAYGFSELLEGQIAGKNDSWAVRWHASAFLANKLTLYPGRSLVHNIGNDSTGTHCGTSAAFDVELSATPIHLDEVVVEESVVAKRIIRDFFRAKRPQLGRIFVRFVPKNIRQKLNGIAKDWLPPVFVRQLRRILRLGGGITFEGPFATWEEAAKHSSGYDDKQILEKVLAATLKVKRGEAAFERDSVLFDEIQYAWPVTAGLMWAAVCDAGRLSVLDFGGSLGSSYFQNCRFLNGLPSVRWSVVEQLHFVEVGRQQIQNEELVFYPTIAECVAAEKPNVVLLSAVLQYLENPYAVLDELVRGGARTILIDRTSFSVSAGPDMYKVQVTSASIYLARYPIRYFDRTTFENWFATKGFRRIEQFQSLDRLDQEAVWQGFIFEKS